MKKKNTFSKNTFLVMKPLLNAMEMKFQTNWMNFDYASPSQSRRGFGFVNKQAKPFFALPLQLPWVPISM